MSLQGDPLPVPAAADDRIEQVLLGLADGSYVLSTADGAVAECGVGVVGLLGAHADGLVGCPTREVLVPGADEAVRRAFDQLLLTERAEVSAPRTFRTQTAAGVGRSLQFVVIAVPLALGWEFTSLLSELSSRDAGTWHPEALRLRHGRALEAIEGVVRDGRQPDPSARLAGILIVVRDPEAPLLTREDVDRRMADQRAAARAAAADAARRKDEAAGRAGAAGTDARSVSHLPGLEDLVEPARVLRERLEEAEHDAAAAMLEKEEALRKLARAEAERDAAGASALSVQAAGEGHVDLLTGERDEARARLAEIRRELKSACAEADAARAAAANAHANLAVARAAADAAEAEVVSTRADAQAARAEAHAAAAAAEGAQADAQSARADAESARAEAEAARAELASAAGDAHAAARAARAEAASARADAEAAREETAAARADGQRARVELHTIRDAVDAERAPHNDSAGTELVALRAATGAARAEVDTLREELQGVRAELQGARETSAARKEELEGARAQLQALSAELERGRAALAARDADVQARDTALVETQAQAELRGVELERRARELEARGEEIAALRGELVGARAEIDDTRAELDAVRAELEHTRGELETAQATANHVRADREQARVRAQQLFAEAERVRAAADAIRAEFAFDADPSADGAAPLQPPAEPAGQSPWSVPAAAPRPPANRERPELPQVGPGQAAALISLDGEFRRLDDAFCSLLGCREEDLRAARWPSIIDRDNLSSHQEIARALKAGEIQRADIETVYMHAQGLLVPISGTVSLHRAERDGEPTHFLFTVEVSQTAGAPGIY